MARCTYKRDTISTSDELVRRIRDDGYIDDNNYVINFDKLVELEKVIFQYNLDNFLQLIDVTDDQGFLQKQLIVKRSFNSNFVKKPTDSRVDLSGIHSVVKDIKHSLLQQQAFLIAEKYRIGDDITSDEYNKITRGLEDIKHQLKVLEELTTSSDTLKEGRNAMESNIKKLFLIVRDTIDTKDLRAESLLTAKDIVNTLQNLRSQLEKGEYEGFVDEKGRNLIFKIFGELDALKRELDSRSLDYIRTINALSSDRGKEILESQLEKGLSDISFIDEWLYDPSTNLSGEESILAQMLHRTVFDTINDIEIQGQVLINESTQREKTMLNYIKDNKLEKVLSKVIKSKDDIINGRIFLRRDEATGITNKLISKYTDIWYNVLAGHNKFMSKLEKDPAITPEEIQKKKRVFLIGKYAKAMLIDYKALMENETAYFEVIKKEVGERQAKKEIENAKKLYREYERAKEYIMNTSEGVYKGGKSSIAFKKDMELWEKANNPIYALEALTKGHRFNYNFSSIIPKASNTQFFDSQYQEFENHQPIIDYIDSLQDQVDFKNRHNPKAKNNLDQSVFIQKQALYDELLKLMANRKFIKVLKLLASRFMDKAKGNPWENLKNDIKLLASRKVESLSPIITRQKYEVNKFFLKSNKTEIEARVVILKNELGLKSKIYYSTKDLNSQSSVRSFANIPNSYVDAEGININTEFDKYFETLYTLVETPTFSREQFMKYLDANFNQKGLNVDLFLQQVVLNRMLQDETFNIGESISLQTQNAARYAGSIAVLPEAILLKEAEDNLEYNTLDNRGIERRQTSSPTTKPGERHKAKSRTQENFERVVELKDTKEIWGLKDPDKAKTAFADLAEHKKVMKFLEKHGGDNMSYEDLRKISRYMKDNKRIVVPGDWGFALSRVVRFLGMGFSSMSAVRNLIEGELTSAVTAQLFDAKGLVKAENVRKFNKISFGTHQMAYALNNHSSDNLYAIVKHFTENHRLLQDASNNLQRALESSTEGRGSIIKSSLFKPYGMIQASEAYNQYPFIAALMEEVELTGKDGTKGSLLDAIEFYTEKDDNGNITFKGIRLKENFNTEEYNDNFITPTGSRRSKAYRNMAYRATFMIKYTNGDFDEFSGNKAKANPFLNVAFTFRSWWPQHLLQMFQAHSYNEGIESEVEGMAFAASSSATYGSMIFASSILAMGVPMAIIVSVLGTIGINSFMPSTLRKTVKNKGVETQSRSIGLLKDIAILSELTAKRSINGIPFLSNMIGKLLGRRELLPTDRIALLGGVSVEELYIDHFGNGDGKATAGAMRAVATILGNMVLLKAMLIATTALLYDDEEPEEELAWYNFLSNELTNFYSQSLEMANLAYQVQNVAELPATRSINNLAKLGTAIGSSFRGDLYNSQTGNMKIAEAATKFLPGMLKYPFTGEPGFKRKFVTTNFDKELRKLLGEDNKEIKAIINADRKALKEQLKKEGEYTEEEIKEIVDEQRPTYKQRVDQLIEAGELEEGENLSDY